MEHPYAALIAERLKKLLPECNREMFYAHLPFRMAEPGRAGTQKYDQRGGQVRIFVLYPFANPASCE
ncbi:hypothetical protein GCM10027422_06870 [Hymenobacter arcticus]